VLPNTYIEYIRVLCCYEAIPSRGVSLDLVRYRVKFGLGGGEFVMLYSVLENRRVCVYVDGIGYNPEPTSRSSFWVSLYPEPVTVASSSSSS
jgi:hypothetical protein